ncbi:MAG: hypothetical protein A2161_00820 [Candidatus Schekmanbacteria bacterium RBG_13_48_7]|uniref:Glycerate kinase n=1 Tax=Candidatus Schekmanbacteria bacterium RBG_13_48_7 TaxID=1817878 RepID=A0A1F7RI04_9BACT|nr:MAG: hypothetical protein A2161_00820 [Candidatus Schekmanbacteria bacterium RBG_13_48_7]
MNNSDWDITKNRLLEIFNTEISAVNPEYTVKQNVKLTANKLFAGDHEYNLNDYDRIVVVGFGKAAALMAKAIEDIFGDRIESGIISVKYGFGLKLKRIKVIEAGHPVPDKNGILAAQKIVQKLLDLSDKDLAICLISGGGSALLTLPVEGITLEDKQAITRLLLNAGATIQELNTIRKHISRVKGGFLARAANPATLISLIMSDVTGNQLDAIASGPTVPDTTTIEDCIRILNRYELDKADLPPAIPLHIQKCILLKSDTPKPGNPIFEKTFNLIIGSNETAIRTGFQKATELGFNAFIFSHTLEGECRTVGKNLVSIAREIQQKKHPVKLPACILAGGETTVKVTGNGKGGRNTELALSAALAMQGTSGISLLSAGSDGNDGDTDAAGAIVDGQTIPRAIQMNTDPFDYLNNNDSYSFFDKLGDLIRTGPTFTNVMDLQIMLVYPCF